MAVYEFDDELKRKADLIDQTPGTAGRGTARGLREGVTPPTQVADAEDFLKGTGHLDKFGRPAKGDTSSVGGPRLRDANIESGLLPPTAADIEAERAFRAKYNTPEKTTVEPAGETPKKEDPGFFDRAKQYIRDSFSPQRREQKEEGLRNAPAKTSSFNPVRSLFDAVIPSAAAADQVPGRPQQPRQPAIRLSGIDYPGKPISITEAISNVAQGVRDSTPQPGALGEFGESPLPPQETAAPDVPDNDAFPQEQAPGPVDNTEPTPSAPGVRSPLDNVQPGQAYIGRDATSGRTYSPDELKQLSNRNVVQGLRGPTRAGGLPPVGRFGGGAFGSLAALGAYGAASRLAKNQEEARLAREKNAVDREVAAAAGLRSAYNAETSRRQLELTEEKANQEQLDKAIDDEVRRGEGPQSTSIIPFAGESKEAYEGRLSQRRSELAGDIRHTMAQLGIKKLEGPQREAMFTAARFKQAVKNNPSTMQAMRDYFGIKRFTSRDLSTYLPKSVERTTLPSGGGYLVHLKNGNTITVRELAGGGFKLLGPNAPVDLDIQNVYGSMIAKFEKSQKK